MKRIVPMIVGSDDLIMCRVVRGGYWWRTLHEYFEGNSSRATMHQCVVKVVQYANLLSKSGWGSAT